MVKKSGLLYAIGWMLCSFCWAQEPVSITGQWHQSIQPTTSKQPLKKSNFQTAVRLKKPVSVLKLVLSNETKKNLQRRITDQIQQPSPLLSSRLYPRSVQLGMNQVPVLDQGEHSTCMVFAMSAALDAALGKGDYVSQICHLQLSQYLNHHTYMQSGWNGAWGEDVANQFMMFGMVPKFVQQFGGCAGRTDYPLEEEAPNEELSVFDYHQISEPIQESGVTFLPLILEGQINSNFVDRDQLLYRIKEILHQGERVTCSLLLMGFQAGDATPSASHHVLNDTWVLSQQMAQDLITDEQSSGHAFVVTGYDDDAIAMDANGEWHRGLFTLRNSWGARVGDQGDFYVTYTYFKAALLEAHHVKVI